MCHFFPTSNSLSNSFRDLKIIGVTDYKNLAATCSDESYYECLAKRFHRTLGKSDIDTETFNGSQCSFHKVCSPFTLPFAEKVPLCQNETIRNCYEMRIVGLEANMDKYCKKSCNTKEFKTEVRDVKYRLQQTDQFGFRYQFGVPQATKDHMSKKPFKMIKEEYLILNEISLIGNVGGTLGMFVGFSFIGTAEWLLDILSNVKNYIKTKRTCN